MDQDIKLHDNNKTFSWDIPKGPHTFFSQEDVKSFNEKYTIYTDKVYT